MNAKWMVAGLILLGVLVASALAQCASVSQRELADAKVKIAGLTALDSAKRAENEWLKRQLARSDSIRRADSVRAAVKIMKLGNRLTDALAVAKARGDSTVTLPVSTVADADTAIKACTDAQNSCERNLELERRNTTNANDRAAAAESAAETMRKLLPTPNQMRVHDAKIATKATVITAAVMILVRAFLVGAR